MRPSIAATLLFRRRQYYPIRQMLPNQMDQIRNNSVAAAENRFVNRRNRFLHLLIVLIIFINDTSVCLKASLCSR